MQKFADMLEPPQGDHEAGCLEFALRTLPRYVQDDPAAVESMLTAMHCLVVKVIRTSLYLD